MSGDVTRLWWQGLAIFAAVVAVVAALLGAIIATARSIDRRAAEIWLVGKQIAGNTVSIWMLGKANDNLERMLDATKSLERSVSKLDERLRATTTSREGS